MRNTDGTTKSTIFAAPAFTSTRDGWAPVDRALTHGSAGSPHVATADRAPVPVRFGKSRANLLQLGAESSPLIVSAPELDLGRPTTGPDGVTYADVAPDTDLNYVVTASGVKERLVLRSEAAPTTFTFHIKDPSGAVGEATSTPSGGFVLPGSGRRMPIEITPPFAVELDDEDAAAGDAPSSSRGSATMTVTKSRGGWDIVQSVSKEWLAEHEYPVVLDPTFVVVGSASTTDCSIDSDPYWAALSRGCGYSLEVGSYRGQAVQSAISLRRGLARFAIGLPAKSSLVTNAKLSLTSWNRVSRPQLVELREAGQPFTRQVTWLTTDGTAPWTPPGGAPGWTQLGAVFGGNSAPETFAWSTPELTSVVARWVSDPASNNGLVVKGVDETVADQVLFAFAGSASTGSDAALRPTLEVTYSSPPAAPGAVVASRSDRAMTVNWTTPMDNGQPITGYTVTAYRADTGVAVGSPVSVPGNRTEATVSGLTNGTSYYATVRATNSLGDSPQSSPSNPVTPAGRPSPPANVQAKAGDRTAIANWTASGANGDPITSYEVTARRVSDSVVVGVTTVPASPSGERLTTGQVAGTADWLASNGSLYTNAAGQLATEWNGTGDGARLFTWPRFAVEPGSLHRVLIKMKHEGQHAQSQVFNPHIEYFDVSGNYITGEALAYDTVAAGALHTVQKTTVNPAPANAVVAQLLVYVPASQAGGVPTGFRMAVYGAAVSRSDLSGAVQGLTNGVQVRLSVRAANSVGYGDAAIATPDVTPIGPPLPPASVTALPGDSKLSVSWSAADPNGSPVTGYTVRTYTQSNHALVGAPKTVPASPLATDVTGLTNGVAYYVTVAAASAHGSSAVSAPTPTVTPGRVADAPASLAASPGDSRVAVSWSEPADNGGASVTSYRVTVRRADTGAAVDPQLTVNAPGTTTTITGLVNGTSYTVGVAATNSFGTGAERVSNSFTPAGLPSAPGSVAATGGDQKISVSWTPSAPNGSSLSGYTVRALDSAGAFVAALTVGPSTTAAEITGLANGQSYRASVVATNAVGDSPAGTSSLVTPGRKPSAPGNVTAARGDTQVALSWTAPTDSGGPTITGYDITVYTGTTPVRTVNVAGSETGATVTGLVNGTVYTASIAATNEYGSGPVTTSTTFTPAGAPRPPTSVTPAAGDRKLTVTWSAADPNGAEVTGYTIRTYRNVDQTLVGSPLVVGASPRSTEISGLTNGVAYYVKVAATNVVGTGAESAATALVTPAGLPDAPGNVTATRGDTSATIAWTAPPSDGGSAITGYTVRVHDGATLVATIAAAATATSTSFTGLTNGTTYTSSVSASNSLGEGARTTSSAFVPAGKPGVVGAATSTALPSGIAVTWTAAPANGTAVTGYTIRIINAATSSQVAVMTASGSATEARTWGLSNGTSYRANIVATSAVGDGAAVNTNTVTPAVVAPATPPIAPGLVSTVAGSGTASSVDGVGTQASLNGARGVAVIAGKAYVATSDTIARVDLATGQVTTISGVAGAASDCTQPPADGTTGATSRVGSVTDMATDGHSLYLLSCSALRRVSLASGAISTIAGKAALQAWETQGTSNEAQSLAIGPDGAAYVSLNTNVLRVAHQTGAVSQWLSGVNAKHGIAFDGTYFFYQEDVHPTYGGGVKLIRVSGTSPSSGTTVELAHETSGGVGSGSLELAGDYIYVGGGSYRTEDPVNIRRYSKEPGSLPVVVAGAMSSGYAEGAELDAWFHRVSDIASDGTNLYVADGGGRLRKISPGVVRARGVGDSYTSTAVSSGVVTTVAGNGMTTTSEGVGTAAGLSNPRGVAVVNGFAYVGTDDTISRVELKSGNVTTISGRAGTPGCVDAAIGTESRVSSITDMASDGVYLYMLSCGALRRVSLANGSITTLVPAGVMAGTYGPGGVAVGYCEENARSVLCLYVTYNATMDKVDPNDGRRTAFLSTSNTNYRYGGVAYGPVDQMYSGVYYVNGPATGAPQISSVYNQLEIQKGDSVAFAGLSYGPLEVAGDFLYQRGASGTNLRRYHHYHRVAVDVAGSATASGYVDAVGSAARFGSIGDVATYGSTLYVADGGSNRLRAVTEDPSQTVAGSALGLDPYAGWVEDVHPGLGNFLTSDTDADVTTVGHDLDLARTYNSADYVARGFGRGWSHSFDMTWAADTAGNVSLKLPDGRREKHTKQPDNTLLPPKGVFSKLVATATGGYDFTDKQDTVFRFAANKTLSSITDANGRTVDLFYDAALKLERVRSASRRELYFTWAGDRISSVATELVAADGAALTWRYYYSPAGELTRVCDPRDNSSTGKCTVYEYAAGRISKVTRPSGTTEVTVAYDTFGKVSSRTNGLGHTTTFSSNGTKITITDPRGHATVQDYDAEYRLITETDPYGKVRSYRYDAAGNRDQQTDANLNVTTSTFDTRGNLTSTTDGEGKTSYSTYDASDNLVAERGARSASSSDDTYKWTYTYDTAGNKLTERSPAVPGFASGITRSWTYTTGTETAIGGGLMPPGLLRTEVDGRGKTTSFAYTDEGDLAETTDPAGLRTTFTYDEIGRRTGQAVYFASYPDGVTTTWTYDVLGNQLTELDPLVTNGVSGVTHRERTTHTYDTNSNRTTTLVEDLAGGDAARTTSFGYDSLDRLIETTDAQTATTIRRTFDEAGSPATVTDQLGRVLVNTYDKNNRLTKTTAKNFADNPEQPTVVRDVVVAQMTYDAAGRKATATDALGRVTQFAYDKADRELTETLLGYRNRDGSARNVVLERHAYDADGNVVEQKTGGDLRTVTTTYDAVGRVTQRVLDPLGVNRTTTYTYDGNGNELTETNAEGARSEDVRSAYDDDDRLISETVENGATDLVTTFGYDTRGLHTSIVNPRGNAAGVTAAAYTTNMTYDALGRLATSASPPVLAESDGGAATSVTPTITIGYDTFGNATHNRDARGNVTVTAYDKINRRTGITHPTYTPPGGAAITPTESFSYDAVGNLTVRSDRRGRTSNFVYDNFNRVTAAYDPAAVTGAERGVVRTTYSDDGDVVARVDQRGARQEFAHDDLGRVRTFTDVVRQPAGAAIRHDTVTDYNDLSDVTYRKTPTGSETIDVYNAAGERTKRTDPAGKIWLQSFTLGRRTGATDPLSRRQEFDFDLAGRATATRRYSPTGSLLSTESRNYDLAGNVSGETSPRGFTTTSSYDPGNRLTSLAEPVTATTSITTTFGYDASGNHTRTTDGRGNTTYKTYTPWNQPQDLVEASTAAHPAAVDRTFTSIYDAGGLPVEFRQPGGVAVTRTFDNLGRVTSESGSGGGTGAATRTFGYDLTGLRTSASHPSGTVGFTYDDRALLTSTTGPAGATTYSYDSAGRLTGRTDPAGVHTFTWTPRGELKTAVEPLTSTTRTQSFDAAGQLTQVAYAAGTQTSHRTLVWDDLGRLTSDELRAAAGTITAAHAYAYDADGNPTSQTITLPGNTGAGVHGYTYDHAGRLTSWTKPGGAVTAYAYDAAGNRTGAGLHAFTFDQRNRMMTGPEGTYAWTARGTLASVTEAGGAVTTHTFDALGRQTGAAGVAYSYDSLDRLAARGAETLTYAGSDIDPSTFGTRKYARTPGGNLLAASVGATATLALQNRHGDLAALHTPGGLLTDSMVYDPYGTPAGRTGATSVALGFQSDLTDPTTGEVWMGARWYDTEADQFTSRDSYGGTLDESVTLNRYTYAGNNPMAFFDPDGHARMALNDKGRAYTAPQVKKINAAVAKLPAKAMPTSKALNVTRTKALVAMGRANPIVGPGSISWAKAEAKINQKCNCNSNDWGKVAPLVSVSTLKYMGKAAVNGTVGVVNGATSAATLGRKGTNFGPVYKGDGLELAMKIGNITGQAALAVGAGAAGGALKAASAAKYVGAARVVGATSASRGARAAAGAVSSGSLAALSEGATWKSVAAGAALGAFGGSFGRVSANAPSPMSAPAASAGGGIAPSIAVVPFNRAQHYGNQTRSVTSRTLRDSAEGMPCPRCGEPQISGTATAPVAQHEPPLMEHYYGHGGSAMTDAERRIYARSEAAFNGTMCHRCQRVEGAKLARESRRIRQELMRRDGDPH